MMLYIKILSTLPEKFINEFNKVAETKLKYRNMLHFYTLTMKYQKIEIKVTILFTITS